MAPIAAFDSWAVTGASGFLGSNLVARLRQAGARVIPVGRQELGATSAEGGLPRLLKETSVVAHLAGQASVGACIKDPVGCHEANVELVRRVLEAARKADVKRVILPSSIRVYGPHVENGAREEDARRPFEAYGQSKVDMEDLANRFAEEHGLDIVIARVSSVYGISPGGRSPARGLVGTFLAAVQSGRPMQVQGDGTQQKDLLWLGDAIRALEALGAKPGPLASQHRALNLGSGVGTAVGDLARLLGRLTRGSTVAAPADPLDCSGYLRIDRIREAVGWRPLVSVEEGAARMRRVMGPPVRGPSRRP